MIGMVTNMFGLIMLGAVAKVGMKTTESLFKTRAEKFNQAKGKGPV